MVSLPTVNLFLLHVTGHKTPNYWLTPAARTKSHLCMAPCRPQRCQCQVGRRTSWADTQSRSSGCLCHRQCPDSLRCCHRISRTCTLVFRHCAADTGLHTDTPLHHRMSDCTILENKNRKFDVHVSPNLIMCVWMRMSTCRHADVNMNLGGLAKVRAQDCMQIKRDHQLLSCLISDTLWITEVDTDKAGPPIVKLFNFWHFINKVSLFHSHFVCWISYVAWKVLREWQSMNTIPCCLCSSAFITADLSCVTKYWHR